MTNKQTVRHIVMAMLISIPVHLLADTNTAHVSLFTRARTWAKQQMSKKNIAIASACGIAALTVGYLTWRHFTPASEQPNTPDVDIIKPGHTPAVDPKKNLELFIKQQPKPTSQESEQSAPVQTKQDAETSATTPVITKQPSWRTRAAHFFRNLFNPSSDSYEEHAPTFLIQPNIKPVTPSVSPMLPRQQDQRVETHTVVTPPIHVSPEPQDPPLETAPTQQPTSTTTPTQENSGRAKVSLGTLIKTVWGNQGPQAQRATHNANPVTQQPPSQPASQSTTSRPPKPVLVAGPERPDSPPQAQPDPLIVSAPQAQELQPEVAQQLTSIVSPPSPRQQPALTPTINQHMQDAPPPAQPIAEQPAAPNNTPTPLPEKLPEQSADSIATVPTPPQDHVAITPITLHMSGTAYKPAPASKKQKPHPASRAETIHQHTTPTTTQSLVIGAAGYSSWGLPENNGGYTEYIERGNAQPIQKITIREPSISN